MAKHMVRLFIEPPQGDAQTAVGNWVQNHNEWVDDPVEHSLAETNTELDGSGTTYVRGDYRFFQDGTATDLLDDLETRLGNIQGGVWYRIGYHVCDHDESATTACSFQDADSEIRENGTIPSDIPELN